MVKGYVHVEIDVVQASKRHSGPCGDVVECDRTATATTLVVCDGKGHGTSASIAANLCAARLLTLLRNGMSLRKAFTRVVQTMEEARDLDLPYSVFTVARILNEGVTSVLTYEMPPPVLVTKRYAQPLPQRPMQIGQATVQEANCHIAPDEGLIIVSDGITMAGIDSGIQGMARGWSIQSICRYIGENVANGARFGNAPQRVLRRARELWGRSLGDDCSVVLANCRMGKTVTIFTGPPSDPASDTDWVDRFMSEDGLRVVAGGTTAQVVANELGVKIRPDTSVRSMVSPPAYVIPGVDLVTEGAITLNQVYNVLNAPPDAFEERSSVTELYEMLHAADRVHIMMGMAVNPATRDIAYQMKGILHRHAIVPVLAERLRAAGKLVIVEEMT